MLLVNGYLFAGSYGDGVFRSSDNGDNWIEVNNGLTAPFVLSFATNASGDIFAGTYFGNGVFRSTDNGDSWNEKNNGLIATEVRTIARRTQFPAFIGHPNINAADFIFRRVPTGAACFARATTGRIGSRSIMAFLRFMKAL